LPQDVKGKPGFLSALTNEFEFTDIPYNSRRWAKPDSKKEGIEPTAVFLSILAIGVVLFMAKTLLAPMVEVSSDYESQVIGATVDQIALEAETPTPPTPPTHLPALSVDNIMYYLVDNSFILVMIGLLLIAIGLAAWGVRIVRSSPSLARPPLPFPAILQCIPFIRSCKGASK